MPNALILCIDNDAAGLFARQRVLESAGYEVVGVPTAEEALQIFRSQPVDLVVSDQMLKGRSGTEIAAEMKAIRPEVPIVILSGLVDAPPGIEIADRFISKTDHPQAFLAQVAELLEGR